MMPNTLVHAQLSPETVNIPMRDGRSLAADLYLPDHTGTYPVVLIQTPYNKNLFRFGLPLHIGQNIQTSPFAFVVLDWRCFWGSIDACNPGSTRGEDGYDAVEWIAAQPWSNGRVGTWGLSALGNIQFMTAREKPPHLVCAVPMVCAPQSRYRQFYLGGVALPEYFNTLNFLFNGIFNSVAQNPYYNLFWQIAEGITYYPDEIDIPMLHIAGWFDHNLEDMLVWHEAMRNVSPAGDAQWLLIGPWTHEGVTRESQGELNFPEAASTANDMALAFFRHYLSEEANGWEQTSPITYFQTGDNTWRSAEQFPPSEGQTTSQFFLMQDMTLSDSSASLPATSLTYTYDPLDPSPTVGGKTLSFLLEQGPADQSVEVESRDDCLLFSTPPLMHDVEMKGKATLHLFISSDRTDTDVAVRLTEVYPDGRSIALGQIIWRMRFRSGVTMQEESLITPGQVYEITMEFDHLAHTFNEGNRIRLVITSSNYPWFNRNMNNGGVMYPNANLDTVVNPLIASNTLHMQGVYPSRLILPQYDGPSSVVDAPALPLQVFPNPAGQYTVISHIPIGAQGTITDIHGFTVRRFTVRNGREILDTGQLSPGIYLITVMSEMRRWIGKVVVH